MMRRRFCTWVLATCALAAFGCVGLKYMVLKGTSVANPPTEPVRIHVRAFPVASKASVIERRAGVGREEGQPVGDAISRLAEAGSGIMEISRPSRLEDLSGAIMRQLTGDRVQVFTDISLITDMSLVRMVENPFELVEMGAAGTQLQVSGRAVIHSQRVSKKFSPRTTDVEIELTIRDVATGAEREQQRLRFGIQMQFNSKELEQAMATAVVTYLTQKTLL